MTDTKSIFDKVPPWVIGSVSIAVIVVALLLFFSNRPFQCSKTNEGFSCGFVREPNTTYKHYIGYFYNWDKERNTYCTSESMDIGYSDDGVSLVAHTSGKIKDRDGNYIERSWVHRGYKHGNNLAIAYVTENRPTTGNGVYYLVQTDGEYAGFWIGINWLSGKAIRCPYVLTDSEKRGNETCEQRWPQSFSKENECKEVSFN